MTHPSFTCVIGTRLLTLTTELSGPPPRGHVRDALRQMRVGVPPGEDVSTGRVDHRHLGVG